MHFERFDISNQFAFGVGGRQGSRSQLPMNNLVLVILMSVVKRDK